MNKRRKLMRITAMIAAFFLLFTSLSTFYVERVWAADGGADIIVVGKDQIGINVKVNGTDNKGIEGAEVFLSYNGKSATAKTNKNGGCVFNVSQFGMTKDSGKFDVSVKLTKDGQAIFECNKVSVNPGHSSDLYMDSTDGKTSYLRALMFDDYDILHRTATYSINSANTATHTIEARLQSFNEDDKKKVMQVSVGNTVVLQDIAGNVLDGNVIQYKASGEFLEKWPIGEISVQLVDKSNTETVTGPFKSGFTSQTAVKNGYDPSQKNGEDPKKDFNSVLGYKADLSSSVPFIGGKMLNLAKAGSTYQVYLSDGGYLFLGINAEEIIKKATAVDWKSKSFEEYKVDFKDVMKNYDKALNNYNKTNSDSNRKAVQSLGSMGGKVQYKFGYSLAAAGKADFTNNKLMGDLYATLSASMTAEASKSFMVGPIPVYVSLDGKGTVSLASKMGMTMKFDSDSPIPTDFDFSWPDSVTLKLGLELGVGAGVGFKGVLSAGIRGYGKFDMIRVFGTGSSRKGTLTLGMQLIAQVLFFKYTKTFEHDPWVLFDEMGNPIATQLANNVTETVSEITSDELAGISELKFTTNSKTEDTSNGFDVVNATIVENADKTINQVTYQTPENSAEIMSTETLVKKEVYQDSKSKLVTIGDKQYLFRIAVCDIDNRDISKLVYQIYENGKWTEEKPVYAGGNIYYYSDSKKSINSTNYWDYDFNIDVRGNKAYIAILTGVRNSNDMQEVYDSCTAVYAQVSDKGSGLTPDQMWVMDYEKTVNSDMPDIADPAITMPTISVPAKADGDDYCYVGYIVKDKKTPETNYAYVCGFIPSNNSKEHKRITNDIVAKSDKEYVSFQLNYLDNSTGRNCIVSLMQTPQISSYNEYNANGDIQNTQGDIFVIDRGGDEITHKKIEGKISQVDSGSLSSGVMVINDSKVEGYYFNDSTKTIEVIKYNLGAEIDKLNVIEQNNHLYLYWTQKMDKKGLAPEYYLMCSQIREAKDGTLMKGDLVSPYVMSKVQNNPDYIYAWVTGQGVLDFVYTNSTKYSSGNSEQDKSVFKADVYTVHVTPTKAINISAVWPDDATVGAGDDTNLSVKITNTGNLILDEIVLNVVNETGEIVKKVNLDLSKTSLVITENEINSESFDTDMDGDGVNDSLNVDLSELTADSPEVKIDEEAARGYLAPGYTHVYKAGFTIPESYKPGVHTFDVKLVSLKAEDKQNSEAMNNGDGNIREAAMVPAKFETGLSDVYVEGTVINNNGAKYIVASVANDSATPADVSLSIVKVLYGENETENEDMLYTADTFSVDNTEIKSIMIPMDSLNVGSECNYVMVKANTSKNAGSDTQTDYVYLNVENPNKAVFANEPSDISVSEGENAKLTVTSENAETYQWQQLVNGTWIVVGDSATLDVVNTTQAMNGNKYRVVVSNYYGQSTSKEVTLTVNKKNNPNPTLPTIQETTKKGTNNKDNPGTGDTTNGGLYIAMIGAAILAVGLIAFVSYKSKNKHEK